MFTKKKFLNCFIFASRKQVAHMKGIGVNKLRYVYYASYVIAASTIRRRFILDEHFLLPLSLRFHELATRMIARSPLSVSNGVYEWISRIMIEKRITLVKVSRVFTPAMESYFRRDLRP